MAACILDADDAESGGPLVRHETYRQCMGELEPGYYYEEYPLALFCAFEWMHTYGCCLLLVPEYRLVPSFTLRSDPTSKVLNLGNNLIKDYGVEAMSCATLGQNYNDHKRRQGQEHRRSKSPRVLNAFGTNLQNKSSRAVPYGATQINKAIAWAQQSGCQDKEYLCASIVGTKDLPPLTGTPLYAAATATGWPSIRHRSPRRSNPPGPSTWSVVLDGNKASERVVAGQGALAGLGEAALFRGCVLPETVAATKSWTRDAFWSKSEGKVS